jgi:hypothetical protein
LDLDLLNRGEGPLAFRPAEDETQGLFGPHDAFPIRTQHHLDPISFLYGKEIDNLLEI